MAEENAVTKSDNDPSAVVQFIQEILSLEETDEDISVEASGDESVDVRGISRCVL